MEKLAIKKFLKIKIRQIKLKIMMCPAVILANKRIHKVNGRMKIPINSMGANKNFIPMGTFGIQKICFQ